jgi:hypothetical protein
MSRVNIAHNSFERTIFQPKKHFDKCILNFKGNIFGQPIISRYTPISVDTKTHLEFDSLAYIKYNGLEPIRFSHLQMLINSGRVNSMFKKFFSTNYLLDDSSPIFPPRRFGKCVCPNCCAYYGHTYRKTGITRNFKLPDISFCPGSIRRWVLAGAITPLQGPRHCIREANRYRDLFRASSHNKFDPLEVERKYSSTSHNVDRKAYSLKDPPRAVYHFFKGFFVHEKVKIQTIVWFPRIRQQGELKPFLYLE